MANDNNTQTNPNLDGEHQNSSSNSTVGSNAIKDPDDWTTGNEPMTAAQRSFIETLTDGKIDENMTKAAASKFIEEHRQQRGNDGGNSGGNSGNNAIKDPDNWTTGSEPITGAQRSYLKTLSDEAGEELDENITKAEASKRIDELQQKTGRGVDN